MNELPRQDSARSRVLYRLTLGPATNTELNTICFRYGARIHELRKDGVIILRRSVSAGVYEYTLCGQPNS